MSRRLKIALIAPGFSRDERDWAIPVLQNIVLGLSEMHDLHVFALRYPHVEEPYHFGKAKIIPFGWGYRSGLRRIVLLREAAANIDLAHQKERFNLVHAFWADEPGYLAAGLKEKSGIPAVVSVMGGELVRFDGKSYGGLRSRINRYLTRAALKGATHVTIGSKFARNRADIQITAEDWQILPLGVDVDRFQAENEALRQPASFNLLSVASLTPIKGHATLIHAFQKINQELPETRLDLVGGGPLLDELKSLSASLNLENCVTFHGAVPHEEMVTYYRQADLYVQSSFYESQGMAVLEAAACGVPVTGTSVGILPELDTHAQLASPGDQDSLYRAVAGLIRDTQARAAASARVVESARREYSLQNYLSKLNKIYQAALR